LARTLGVVVVSQAYVNTRRWGRSLGPFFLCAAFSIATVDLAHADTQDPRIKQFTQTCPLRTDRFESPEECLERRMKERTLPDRLIGAAYPNYRTTAPPPPDHRTTTLSGPQHVP
jgi:hypothetical protein